MGTSVGKVLEFCAEANILAQTAGVPSIPWSGDGLEANLGPDGTIPEEHSLMVQSFSCVGLGLSYCL